MNLQGEPATVRIHLRQLQGELTLFGFPWQLLDLKSTNGILHNGVRVSEVQLSDGDIITFGGGKSTELNARPAPEVLSSRSRNSEYH